MVCLAIGMNHPDKPPARTPNRPQTKPKRLTGFTLVELAIVLFVITLMISTSLKASELINVAQAKKLAAEFKNISTQFYGYQDKYRALPGDDRQAAAHLGLATVLPGNGNGVIDGNWFDQGPGSEASRLWQHLRLAKLTDGPTNLLAPDYDPTNALGKRIGLQSGSPDPAGSPIMNAAGQALVGNVVICSRGIPGSLVLSLDASLDDGNPASGSMLATPDNGGAYALGAAPATAGIGPASDVKADEAYIVCLGA